MTFYEKRRGIYLICAIGILAMVLLAVFSATLGAADISFSGAWRVMAHRIPLLGNLIDIDDISKMHQTIILNLRIPRILLAIMVGGLLAGSGTVYQSVFRNPMADPFVLGVSSGAALGAAATMIFGLEMSLFGISSISVAAFIGALVTTFIVYRVSSSGGKTPVMTLILTGIAMSFFLSSILSLLITFNRDQLEQIVFWSYGSLSTTGWRHIYTVLPFYAVSMGFFLLKGRVLNILTLGEESASSLGVDVQKERKILLAVASLATAAAVAVTGIIGFVGLVVPHMLRLITGPDNRSLLPYTIIAGGIFMLVCDAVARTAIIPMEIPIGIITSAIGAPYFIYLIVRNKKRGLS
ncbi:MULTISPECIES: iron ABC transporter permease [unclassified Fusibacter]|uniref:FecCD family ABC transporter permease n=1 Tax=unclassified Fusibacter TaxID=2624464 RepID=UPI0013E90BCC|nr:MULTISPECIES: iron chelate uptake ABC transporter family permease subunit [unclassified Fusibacter]MCK8059275.1 iron ABC transporter permease [Fusibacter sp. A2]NPE21261.1 iron chelate uptake ABC transporter family permease subunit [Fusibacter sp. A1]